MGVQELEIWDMVGSFPTCPLCKGSRVIRDAWAAWNGHSREWDLRAILDSMSCGDCSMEIEPVWQLDDEFRLKRIRRLNDEARRGEGINIAVVITPGVQGLGHDNIASAVAAISKFDDFSVDNDPYHEHDFGAITLSGEKLFWKIDYFDLQLKWHSPDKANPAVTQRVLTIMLASEY